jgi:SRSO17 transposase
MKRLLELHPVTEGILVVEETERLKKGPASVGVSPPSSGTLSTVGSGQVVVTAESLANDPAMSSPFHAPVNVQRCVPKSWTQDAHRRTYT